MKLIYELSKADRNSFELPKSFVPSYELNVDSRECDLPLPEVSEIDIVRHYTELANHAFGVDNGFYPLGSCTMKYNPKLNEIISRNEGFTNIHPLQPNVDGAKKLLKNLSNALCELTGMTSLTLQPAAGAHGEFTGLSIIKAYHTYNKAFNKTKIIVPDSAHGTNPASASMCGFTIVNCPSNDKGGVDIDVLKTLVDDDTAGLMLTNPNTLGLFDENILEITKTVHNKGGLCYYDGANFNAIMGIARPADMGFDVVHLNLHKTFSTPHGGGGPGAGAVGVVSKLSSFLPTPVYSYVPSDYNEKLSIGKVKCFDGNFNVCVKAYAYILTLGGLGLKDASQKAVLNANYMLARLKDQFTPAYNRICMHEFVLSLQDLKDKTGVSALDFAKGIQDQGIHPPTMYFPLIVHEALMFEPTETETKETLDNACDTLLNLYENCFTSPQDLHDAPKNAYIERADEVLAARQLVLSYKH